MNHKWGRRSRLPLFLFALSFLSLAQPRFEVASIKVAESRGGRVCLTGGPGTATPTRFTARRQTLLNLIAQAYDVPPYLVDGPEWLQTAIPSTPRFDVDATVAPGATPEQFKAMFQNLLAERFTLKAHRERRESAVYRLTAGKGEPKLHENTDPPAPEGTEMTFGPKASDGFATIPRGLSNILIDQSDGGMALKCVRCNMTRLISLIGTFQNGPVIDETGLKGTYDVILRFSYGGANEHNFPELPAAIQEQLNLKLVPGKAPVEFLVIDGAAKLPTGN
jgi:uncharacterized protein (TIGR03435 family)